MSLWRRTAHVLHDATATQTVCSRTTLLRLRDNVTSHHARRRPHTRGISMSAVPHFPPPHLVPDAEEQPASRASERDGHHEPLALPGPTDTHADMDGAEGHGQQGQVKARTLHLSSDGDGGGSSVKLDELGPMVVNQDGTLSRIHNWPQMAAVEREATLRVLGKRNRERLAALRAQQERRDEQEEREDKEREEGRGRGTAGQREKGQSAGGGAKS